jgi:hypothetical protein
MARFLCVENTAVADVEFDDEAQVLVAHVWHPLRRPAGRARFGDEIAVLP